ncbi:hypothetical protein BJP25_30950 [Actinokineospora bangkokensis]|uniref:DUF3558 domain-containing protein n=1 Tax=Actinokineospora bangkokensis TaxID=1193682 RepID=A0A1Q9LG28_9PSEU|nr:hypothetical protein BJP25_30950 [Actinokineospora bangkokensis]
MDNPLDVSKFAGEPCTGLTAAQAGELGVENGTPDTGAASKSCTWNNQYGAQVNLAFFDNRGLDAIFAAERSGAFTHFERVDDVDGYPAVVALTNDRRGKGECSLWVGVAEDSTISLATAQSRENVGTTDPCSVSTRVADLVVKTVKAGG